MPETLTISLVRPVAAFRVANEAGHNGVAGGESGASAPPTGAGQLQKLREIEQHEQSLRQSCGAIDSIIDKLNDLYQNTVAQNRSDIAKLAVEIARKILNWKTDAGDYDIHTTVEEALKRAPTRQELVVRVNPEDLPRCQQLQQENPDSQFAELNFVADWGVARADCLIETPKGIVRSFIEEHLGRIAEALEKAQ